MSQLIRKNSYVFRNGRLRFERHDFPCQRSWNYWYDCERKRPGPVLCSSVEQGSKKDTCMLKSAIEHLFHPQIQADIRVRYLILRQSEYQSLTDDRTRQFLLRQSKYESLTDERMHYLHFKQQEMDWANIKHTTVFLYKNTSALSKTEFFMEEWRREFA